MIYLTYHKETKKVCYIGKKRPIAYTDNLQLVDSETYNIPEDCLKTPRNKLRVDETTQSINIEN